MRTFPNDRIRGAGLIGPAFAEVNDNWRILDPLKRLERTPLPPHGGGQHSHPLQEAVQRTAGQRYRLPVAPCLGSFAENL